MGWGGRHLPGGMRKIWTNPNGGGQKILDASQRARGANNFRLDLNFFKVYVNNSWWFYDIIGTLDCSNLGGRRSFDMPREEGRDLDFEFFGWHRSPLRSGFVSQSVSQLVTNFSPCSHWRIFMKLTQYMCLGNILSHAKGQGHRSKGQRSRVQK